MPPEQRLVARPAGIPLARARAALGALLVALTPALAQSATKAHAQVYTAKAVMPAALESQFYQWLADCPKTACVVAQLKQNGIHPSALQFYQDTGFEGYLGSFTESGRVDLGEMQFPGRANTNTAPVMLNGSPAIVSTEGIGKSIGNTIRRTPQFARLQKQYPALELWDAGADLVAATPTPSGGQRFVFAYPLKNGCHACGTGHDAHIAFDFDRRGRYQGLKFLTVN